MCNCKNITPQTKECYAQMVTVEIPPHMEAYKNARLKEGLSSLVSIDPCIYDEIKDLWNKGVITHGSCCGHNKFESMVNVQDDQSDLMLSMGYELNHPDPTRIDTFKLKSA